jgi:hypothetical protein
MVDKPQVKNKPRKIFDFVEDSSTGEVNTTPLDKVMLHPLDYVVLYYSRKGSEDKRTGGQLAGVPDALAVGQMVPGLNSDLHLILAQVVL